MRGARECEVRKNIITPTVSKAPKTYQAQEVNSYGLHPTTCPYTKVKLLVTAGAHACQWSRYYSQMALVICPQQPVHVRINKDRSGSGHVYAGLRDIYSVRFADRLCKWGAPSTRGHPRLSKHNSNYVPRLSSCI